MLLTFVETALFTRRWHERLGDDDLRALQNGLLADPEAGDRVPGCGVLRKLRFRDPSRGKGRRGGLRVIYLYTPEAARIDLIVAYGKDRRDDLSADEWNAACRIARLIRAELIAAMKRTGRKGQE